MTQGSRPTLDLRFSHSRQTVGDITVHMTWLMTNGDPCIVLVPSRARTSFERVTPCVVPLATAWLWDEDAGDPAHADQTAFNFAANLGLSGLDRRTVLRIQRIIRDRLGDLLSMRPMPRHVRAKIGDLVVTNNETGQTDHKEVRDVL